MLDLEKIEKQISVQMKLVDAGYIQPENGNLYKNKEHIYKTYEDKLAIDLSYDRRWFMNPYDAFLSIIFRDNGIFALITEEFVETLADFIKDKKVLEIMAGKGYLSMALKERGIDIVATDDKSWHITSGELGSEVETLDAKEAINKYGENIDFVIMAWPPLDDRTDNDVLMELRKINKDAVIILIGEGNGCTGSDDFHKNKMIYVDKEFEKVQKSYKPWDCLNDYVSLVK